MRRADIETARQIAGHSSVTITQRYCHSDDLTKRSAIEAMDNRDFRESVATGGDKDEERANWQANLR